MKKHQILNRPKTAVIYTRVSSDMQVNGYSLEDQQRNCREYCKREGLEVLKVFVEQGESAKTAERTQLRFMQDFCLKNMYKVGYVVVWKIDRFSRNQLDYLTLRKFFLGCGTDLKSATEVIENTPQGKFTESILSAQAQYDNEVKAERTISGMRSKALDGLWAWGAPWGYKNQTLKESGFERKIIVPDPERVHIIKFLFEEYSRGTTTFRELATKVNEMGDLRSKHGLKMTHQLVQKILTNPIHCGRIEVPLWGISTEGKHIPIISVELFQEVGEVMRGGKSRKLPRSRNNPEFPLRGVQCACGSHISGGFVKGRKKRYAYYGCIKKCADSKSIPRDELENSFTEFLERYTPNSDLMEALLEALKIVQKKQSTKDYSYGEKIQRKLEKLHKELDGLLQLRLDGSIDNKDFLDESDKRKILKRELETELKTLNQNDGDEDRAIEFSIKLIQNLPSIWRELKPAELRLLRNSLFPKNIQYTESGFQTALLSPIYKVKAASGSDENRLVTQVGLNWNQIVTELNSWYVFGRDLEVTLNSREKSVMSVI